ncbi:MAG: hypothetical protein ACOC6G_04295 [Thermoproteota archaeon]
MGRGEQCPRCKSKQIEYSGRHDQEKRCKNCGFEWRGKYSETGVKKEHRKF